MSGFADVALPGRMPTAGSGAKDTTAEKLFMGSMMRRASDSGLRVKKVKVAIFDLSDDKQRHAYERLWSALLSKVASGRAVVDHSKDLVRRADGTSYWLKYVEYVEFDYDPKTRTGKDAR